MANHSHEAEPGWGDAAGRKTFILTMVGAAGFIGAIILLVFL